MSRPHDLSQAYEEYAVAGGQRALVTRLASRFFVVRGPRTQPLTTYEVVGPYSTGWEAMDAAQRLSRLSFMQAERAEVSP